jgi:hypothetical protein
MVGKIWRKEVQMAKLEIGKTQGYIWKYMMLEGLMYKKMGARM